MSIDAQVRPALQLEKGIYSVPAHEANDELSDAEDDCCRRSASLPAFLARTAHVANEPSSLALIEESPLCAEQTQRARDKSSGEGETDTTLD